MSRFCSILLNASSVINFTAQTATRPLTHLDLRHLVGEFWITILFL